MQYSLCGGIPSAKWDKFSTLSTVHPEPNPNISVKWSKGFLKTQILFINRGCLLCTKLQEHENVEDLQLPKLYMSQQQKEPVPMLPHQSPCNKNNELLRA